MDLLVLVLFQIFELFAGQHVVDVGELLPVTCQLRVRCLQMRASILNDELLLWIILERFALEDRALVKRASPACVASLLKHVGWQGRNLGLTVE